MLHRAYLILERKTLFFFSFKAGNTSLMHWIFDRVKPGRLDISQVPKPRLYLKSPNIEVAAPTARDLVMDHGFSGALIARDPYARAVSGYLNKFVRDGERWLESVTDCEPPFQQILSEHPRYSFLDHLLATRDAARAGNWPAINPHWAPQVRPTSGPLLSKVVRIRLENVDEELERFCQEVGVAFSPFPRARATAIPAGEPPQGDLSRVDRSDLARGRILPTAGNLLTPECVELINEIYQLDFDCLGYARR